jgi:hypothetical protein
MKNQNTWFLTSIVIMSALLVAVGCACPINTTIKVTATDGPDIGKLEFVINVAEADGYFEWILDGGRDIVGNNGDILGSIEYLKLKIIEDPANSVEFYVTAGNLTTTFTITADSAVTFDPIINPEVYASAGITLTDRNQNGAKITGLYGGKAYRAVYNDSIVYANLVDSFTADVRKTVTQSENYPASGDTEIIGNTLFSINSSFNFTLSAKDSAAGTSYFEVSPVPEPATIAFLVIGTAAFLRKK